MSLIQDTIQISSNGGTTWGSDITIPLNGTVPITGFGIDVSFSNYSGHTIGDYWSFTQGAMRGIVITDATGNEYFSASSGALTTKNIDASGTIKGNVTGNVTGNLTGNVTGNVTGDVNGNVNTYGTLNKVWGAVAN